MTRTTTPSTRGRLRLSCQIRNDRRLLLRTSGRVAHPPDLVFLFALFLRRVKSAKQRVGQPPGSCKKRKDGAPSVGAVPTNIIKDGPPIHYLSASESSMSSVQIEQKSYEMPPKEGISVAHFLTVADVNRSARYYEKVFGARILTMGDGNAPPYLQLANIWMILNVGGGPTPDKPTVTLSVPDPNHINSFMNFRVADIQACYKLWKSRGAEFITEPIPKYGEIRCYIRDPDGYIIEVGQ